MGLDYMVFGSIVFGFMVLDRLYSRVGCGFVVLILMNLMCWNLVLWCLIGWSGIHRAWGRFWGVCWLNYSGPATCCGVWLVLVVDKGTSTCGGG